MKLRWDSITEDINLFVSLVKKSAESVLSSFRRSSKGRPPKRSLTDYVTLLVLKEDEKKSLRGAEGRLSFLVCKDRVDHSVIAFWEKKVEMQFILEKVVRDVGQQLMRKTLHEFSMIDATSFSSWRMDEVVFHLCNRISHETVYPSGISFLTGTVRAPVDQAIDPGGGKFYADAGYDDNDSIGIIFKKGYEPIVCPNTQRRKGYYRKKARKLYKKLVNRLGYRQRGRGESCFGSLTNKFGERLHARKKQVMKIRITARVISYQIRLLMRASSRLLQAIIRHARFSQRNRLFFFFH